MATIINIRLLVNDEGRADQLATLLGNSEVLERCIGQVLTIGLPGSASLAEYQAVSKAWTLDGVVIEEEPRTALELWAEAENIPINDNDEILEPFLDFEVGTNRFEIWHWFEEHFDIVLESLMNAPEEEGD
jgi:hypothetical protein